MDMIIAGLIGSAALALIIMVYFLLDYRRHKQDWKKKMRTWYPEEKRKSAISVLGDRYDESPSSEKLHKKLQLANVGLLPSEYIGAHIVGFLLLYVVFNMIFSMSAFISLVLTVGLLASSHFLLFYLRKNRYEERFNEQLSEVCRLLANASKSGMTVTQGIDLVANEVSTPAKEEFKRMSYELKLGVPLEQVLKKVQERNTSRDFQLFAATLLIQKKTGGNLASTLETMATTLEDRKILHQTIRTMTSEQRYISIIVPAMPIFILLVMNNVMDGFTDPLTTTPGLIILALFGAGIILSFFLIRKITNIKV
ncbi:type II secretion system F family protein [Jeotgalibacillus haloalkalitolerans]|uniref:Type II secretion system F family protein n=1 Tax=Jeotgalibacillus haloalkalitolerans TaxID=3104292 RepID=A0ABU5KR80_9BACL|nr:type II secretion system F family protein [Jeotgalibacillus sp. HH7-29]MDZ5713684.1 type II secretion system F family protein [Jeotgalibacillus sp. HH7-29]